MKSIRSLRKVSVALLLLVAFLFQGTWALAGTTGGLSGTVKNAKGAPIAGAKVTVTSPSQQATATTDASGNFNFISLAPDTYTVVVEKSPYQPVTENGITVFADQSYTVGVIMRDLKTIAVLRTSAGTLVKSGTTASVYSINAATQQIEQGAAGGYNLTSAYSAIYSQPGVNSSIGNYGFGQVFYVRGSAYSQVGYEYDGVPVNRAFDNYAASSAANLGNSEVQVYTGSSPAGNSSATLGGFINQVIQIGTYPGFASLTGTIGAPGFRHDLTAEAGGATPNRLFSYYVGVQGTNQTFRTGNNQDFGNLNPDGSNQYGLFTSAFNPTANLLTNFATQGPWATCGATGPPTGAAAFGGIPTCNYYAPFAQTGVLSGGSTITDRENIVNLHFAIPHKKDGGRDDVQLLYNTFGYLSSYNDSVASGLGGLAGLNSAYKGYGGTGGYVSVFYPLFTGQPFNPNYPGYNSQYPDMCAYMYLFSAFGLNSCATSGPSVVPYADSQTLTSGAVFGGPASGASVGNYLFPSSPTNRTANYGISPTLGDGIWNDGSIIKLQYQKNIGSSAYLRVLGYTFYSDWLHNAPAGLSGGLFNLPYPIGYDNPAPDYELSTHTRGFQLQYANQINDKNLVQFTGNYTTATVLRNNNEFWAQPSVVSSYLGTNGNCYDYTTGALSSCTLSGSQGSYQNLQPGTAPAGSPAALAGATWQITRPGLYGPINTVRPQFSNFSLTDEFRPNSKLDLNLGLRYENYKYNMQNMNTPEFNFWFNQFANAYCYDPDTGAPYTTKPSPKSPPSAAGAAAIPNLVAGQNAGMCYQSSTSTAPLLNGAGHQYLHPNGVGGNLLFTANGPSSITKALWSPRVSGTYTFNRDTVIRFGFGRYTQPTETAFEQYSNASGYGAAKFDFTHFWSLGFTTPVHDNPVQTSNNYDFSLEKHLKGTDITLKLTPFYRYTTNQLVSVLLGPNFVSGVNAGTQKTTGIEFAFQKGDPSRNGLSTQLSYTYTHARIKYNNLSNGTNGVDAINSYIISFNQLTSFCKTNPTDARCGNITSAAAANIAPCYLGGSSGGLNGTNTPDTCAVAADITNPYYNTPVQSLLDRNAYYPVYANNPPSTAPDGGLSTAFGPSQFAGFLNYHRNKFTVALNVQLNQGSRYGSPLSVLGVDPRVCGGNQAASGAVGAGSAYAQAADYQTCSASPFTSNGSLAIPDPNIKAFDTVGQYRNPWQINGTLQFGYLVNQKVKATLVLANIFNRCFGGSSTPWSSAYKPGSVVCGYSGNGSYIGSTPGAGYFYGANGADAANGTAGYPNVFNYQYAPVSGALPFQAYLQVNVKL